MDLWKQIGTFKPSAMWLSMFSHTVLIQTTEQSHTRASGRILIAYCNPHQLELWRLGITCSCFCQMQVMMIHLQLWISHGHIGGLQRITRRPALEVSALCFWYCFPSCSIQVMVDNAAHSWIKVRYLETRRKNTPGSSYTCLISRTPQ